MRKKKTKEKLKGGGKKKMRDFPKDNLPETTGQEEEIEELTRKLEDKRKELNELKNSEKKLPKFMRPHAEPDERDLPPMPSPRKEENVQVIERAVTLELINEKQNYIIGQNHEIIKWIKGERE